MSEPQISDELFQTWLIKHINLLMRRPGKWEDVRQLYGTAFIDGWSQALIHANRNQPSAESPAQMPFPQRLEFEPAKDPTSIYGKRSDPILVTD